MYISVDIYLHLGITQRSSGTCAKVCYHSDCNPVNTMPSPRVAVVDFVTLRSQHVPALCHNIYKHI